MEKRMKKGVKIAIIVVAIIIVLGVAAYFYLSSQGYIGSLNFNFGGNPSDAIGAGTDANIFDDAELNPFNNETGE